jgi:hypothetical protein
VAFVDEYNGTLFYLNPVEVNHKNRSASLYPYNIVEIDTMGYPEHMTQRFSQLLQFNNLDSERYPGFKIVLGYFACLVHRSGVRPRVYSRGRYFRAGWRSGSLSGFLMLFFGSREQDIIQDKPETG